MIQNFGHHNFNLNKSQSNEKLNCHQPIYLPLFLRYNIAISLKMSFATMVQTYHKYYRDNQHRDNGSTILQTSKRKYFANLMFALKTGVRKSINWTIIA